MTMKTGLNNVSKIRFQGTRNGNEVIVPSDWIIEVRELSFSFDSELGTLWIDGTEAFTGINIDPLAKLIIVGYAGSIDIDS